MNEDCAVGPLQLLCEDAWLEVFKYLDPSPRDLLNIGWTCTLFQDLLDNFKICGRGASVEVCQLEEILPLLLKFLSKKEVCIVRLVCQRITRVVDKMINENRRIVIYKNLNLIPELTPPNPLNWPLQNSHESRNLLHWNKFVWDLGSLEDIQRFEGYLEEASRMKNRKGQTGQILGKTIFAGLRPNEEEDRLRQRQFRDTNVDLYNLDIFEDLVGNAVIRHRNYLEAAIEFFEKFPESFRFVYININYLSSFREFYDYLRRALGTFQNICQLTMSCRNFPRSREHGRIPFLPLPPSPKLERLSIHSTIQPEALLRQISKKYGGHLKELMLEVIDDGSFIQNENEELSIEELDDDGEPYNFPSLLELSATMVVSGTIAAFRRVQAPQLKFLDLSDSKMEDLNLLLRIILTFPLVPALHLWIGSSRFTNTEIVMRDLDTMIQRHQNLLVLKLIGWKFNFPLRFFTKLCPNLKIIKMEVLSAYGIAEWDIRDEDFKLIRDGRSQESRLWTDAPHLEEVRLKDVWWVTRSGDVHVFHQLRNTTYHYLRPEGLTN